MKLRIALLSLSMVAIIGFAGVRGVFNGGGSSEPPASTASRRSTAAAQLQILEQTVRDDAGDARALAQLATLYVERAREKGDPAYYALAGTAAGRARALDADDVPTLVVAGALALARHDFEGALGLGEQARALNPNVNATYGVITDALVELGRYDEALLTAQEMIDRRPDFASLSRVSYLRELHGDISGAIEAMLQAADGSGVPFDRAWALVIIGNLYLQQGDVDSADASYRRAQSVLPGDGMVQAALARTAMARGDLVVAEALLRSAVEARPLPEYATVLGDLLGSQGRTAEANEQYALVRATQRLYTASGVDTDIELALFDADHGVDPARTFERALAAYSRRPGIYSADTVAWAAYRAGRLEDARRYSAESLRLGTRDARLAYHAGMIAQAAGDSVSAEAHLRAAVAMEHALPLPYAKYAHAALQSLVPEASAATADD